jgi:hypothetical protein
MHEQITTSVATDVPPLVETERAVLEAMRLAARVRDADAVAKYADALRALRGS